MNDFHRFKSLKHLSAVSLFFVLFVPAFADDRIDFQRDVRPILSETCFDCHGPDAATREADFRLDQLESAMSVIEPGDAEASELVRRILSDDPDERMPPPSSKRQPSDDQRRMLAVHHHAIAIKDHRSRRHSGARSIVTSVSP